jgi:hypothetical protein
VHYFLDRAEGVFSFNDSPAANDLSEALAILMGGGMSNLDAGIGMAMQVRRRQVNEYMHRLEVAGFGDRRERMHPTLRMFLNPPKN